MAHLQENKTPRLPNWIASKLIDDSYLEEFFGDLEEIFDDRVSVQGKFRASLMYWVDVFHLLIGFNSINIFKTQNNQIMMIKNMFKIAWRNAIRQKQFSILNLLGLSIGIMACIFIGLYVHSELTYDDFHTNGDRIYRVNQPMIWGDWNEQYASTGPNVAVALREDAPAFEQVTRIQSIGAQYVNYKQEGGKVDSYKEQKYFVAEDNFFDVFSFEFLQGDPVTALDSPWEIVLTKETAERYFGYEDAMGKLLEVKHWDGTWKTYTVRGVLSNIPVKSHIQFDMLVSLKSYQSSMDKFGWKWIWTGFSTYGLVHKGTDIEALRENIQAIPPKWAAPTTEKIFNQSFEEFTDGKPWTLFLQPLDEIYISGTPRYHSFGPTGNPRFVKIFAAIGLLILILSSINFMNLSTAKSSNRAKEVGIRKVLGSNRKSLMFQFVFESIAFVIVSTLLAFVMVTLTLDWFNNISEKQLELLQYLSNPTFWVVIIGFVISLGMLAGSYPAFYLSSFRPIETLKGKSSVGFKGKGLRNGLVVFQFTISIALIICAFFVQKQLSYASTVDLGFAKENILQIHNIEQFGFETSLVKTTLESNPAFTHVGKSFGIPPTIYSGDRYKAFGADNPVLQMNNFRTGEDYLNLLGLEFIEGRNFDKANSNDKYGVVLNESAVKEFGWGVKENNIEDSPIGKFVALASGNEAKFEVIGVVKDFNFTSLKRDIGSLIIINHQNDRVWDYRTGLSYYSLKINPTSIKNADELQLIIEQVENAMTQLDASVPFEYSFIDKEFEKAFRSEQKMGSVLNIFTTIALAIACLGLFGLAAFSAEQRTKELGIRKVLGASIKQIVMLFSSEFTKLIMMSILISTPLAYYLVNLWLVDFAYRTPTDIWVFVAAAGSALMIALFTIGYQSLMAAFRNPVESLKDE